MIALEWDPAEVRVLSFLLVSDFKLSAVVATRFIWIVRTSFPGSVSSQTFNSDMSDSFAELFGTSSGSHLQQSGDPADDTETCLQQQLLSAPSASELQFFGGDEVSVASPSPFLEPGHAWPEPAETSDKQTRPDVLVSKSECNRLLFEARMSSMGDAGMKLPWEQGVWKRIFADYDDDVFPTVVPPVPGEYLQ